MYFMVIKAVVPKIIKKTYTYGFKLFPLILALPIVEHGQRNSIIYHMSQQKTLSKTLAI